LGGTIDDKGNIFDSLSYGYNVQSGLTLQNRLYNVNNAASLPNSMPNQGTFNDALTTINNVNNYRYTALGELAKDTIGGIDTIVWNVYGKVWRIKQYNGDSLTFFYDTKGDRIEKDYLSGPGNEVKTYYVRDTQGNILSIYSEKIVTTIGFRSVMNYNLTERDIYGSKRIGTDNTPVQLFGALPVSLVDTFSRYLGNKNYEMDNHLGNVLVTLTDRKIPISLDTNTGTAVDHYEADVLSSTDYYPFGMEEPGRNSNSTGYRFGFNAKEKTDEVYGSADAYDYGMRFYDPRLGRFMSIDPLAKKYPYYSTYQFAGNMPIKYVDLDGLEPGAAYDQSYTISSSDDNSGDLSTGAGNDNGSNTDINKSEAKNLATDIAGKRQMALL
jgi:RHS repeat-associated protein